VDRLKIGVAAFGLVASVASGGVRAQAADELDFLMEDPSSSTPAESAPAQPAEPGSAAPASEQGIAAGPEPEPEPEQLPTIPVAQKPEAPVPAAPKSRVRSALVEEIVVTAQKREENVQDVPIAISAFSGDQMEALGVNNPYDLALVVPGLQSTEAVGFSVTFLRGVGTDAFLMADPSVALYVDDVYLPFAMAANQKFGKLERMEVLKGPQGTLFGRNAVGGAINVVTKKPDFESFAMSLDLEAGDYGHQAGKIFVNIPVLDNLALGLTALADRRDSYYDGVMNRQTSNPDGDPVGGEDAKGYQAKLRYMPTDWLDIALNATWVKEEGTSGLYSPNDDPSPLGSLLGIQPQHGFHDTVTSDPAYLHVDNTIYSGNMKFSFESFDMKLLASLQEIETGNAIDFDGSPMPLAGFTLIRNFADIKTAEFQLLSNADSWGADNWSWILGAYYFDSTQGVNPSDLFVGSTNLQEGVIFGIDLDQNQGGLLQNVIDQLGALPVPLPNGRVIFDGIIATESTSGFFQTTYRFTDSLATTLGGRYQEETRSIVDSRSYLMTIDGERGTPLFDSTDKSRFPDLVSRKFAPKISLEFRPLDNVLAYASWQQAQKSGTYNVINVIDNADAVEPEDIAAYEVGLKAEWFDGLLRTNLAAFHYDQKNLQVQFVSLLAGGAIRFDSAEEATVNGVDFDLVADLFPSLFNGLYLTASGAVLDAKFEKYTGASGFDENTGQYGEDNDYSGNRIPRAPEFSGRIGLNKIFSYDNSTVEVAGDYYYNSGYFTSASNTSASEQRKYDLTNARLTYSFLPWKLSLTGYVRNVFDEQYSISKLNTDFGTITGLAAPRTIGLMLGWEY